MIYQNLNLYITNGNFIIEPQTDKKSKKKLIIEKTSGKVSLGEYSHSVNSEKVVPILGIFGIVQINSGTALIAITEKEKIGDIYDTEVFKIKKVAIYPCSKNNSKLTEIQKNDDQIYLSMITEVFKQCNFYFSYTRDITLNAQVKIDHSLPIWATTDERFYWNYYMQKPIRDLAAKNPNSGFDEFILPVICGFCSIIPTEINDQKFIFAIISRRSRFRVGTRYNRRGIDDDGNVANYVETEQYISIKSSKEVFSYIQTRGSIPLYWQQIININYYPRLLIESNPNTKEAFKKHFDEQLQRYHGQIVINLIKSKGDELRICDEYTKQIEETYKGKITYVHFDLRKECSNMRWDRISFLVDKIKDELNKQGYYHKNINGEIVQTQSSVCRTNCMDCLDRTNVVQSYLARRVLTIQLRESGILGPQQEIEEFKNFINMFNNVWTDNANAMSIQYSGTDALITDITRTGKRTAVGAMTDLKNAIVRYVKNNFKDGRRQDGFDFFLGNYVVDKNAPTPFVSSKSVKAKILPYAFLGSTSMFFFSLLSRKEFSSPALFEILVWFLLIVGTTQQIFSNGEEIVNKPLLIKPHNSNSSQQNEGETSNQSNVNKIKKDKEN